MWICLQSILEAPININQFPGDGITKAREAAEGAEGEDSSDGRCVGCLVVNMVNNDTHMAQKDRAVFVSYSR